LGAPVGGGCFGGLGLGLGFGFGVFVGVGVGFGVGVGDGDVLGLAVGDGLAAARSEAETCLVAARDAEFAAAAACPPAQGSKTVPSDISSTPASAQVTAAREDRRAGERMVSLIGR
jgi:hypothetical protein